MNIIFIVDENNKHAFQEHLEEIGHIARIDAVRERDNFDATAAIEIITNFVNQDMLLLTLGYLIGKNSRFYIDEKGFHFEIKNMNDCIEVWNTLRNLNNKDNK